ncbi:hypothetical protein PHSY_004138 [Pseudozyma hubeiensis SY62]|uniref:Uncharacterized protein n=1 Tax=Pseudozyma hubeiensis (strain SY62) TaxID=1305764 RepID=R9P5N9_PSEHS|nr:hypothetical protein PHSY_004138 [Pseudozyma hubeiensis SY62]GAC96557.1 hypothetical protein PHSY_004138 [Pseudozyma hubeiensis SY62]
MLNYAEYYQNGNVSTAVSLRRSVNLRSGADGFVIAGLTVQFQLSVTLNFETNVSAQKLRQRFGLAVWAVRGFLPELGMWTTTTSTDGSLDLDHVTFTALQTADEAQEWIQDTAIVVDDGTTTEELMNYNSNHRIEPPGKQFRVYLVLNPRRGSPSIVLNASHVLNGHRAHVQCCAILEAMMSDKLVSLLEATPDPRLALGALFAPEDVSKVLGKLPISLDTAYQERFKPTETDLDVGMEKLGERLTNSALPTIGVPRFESPAKSPEYSLGNAHGQPMTMLNLKREMDFNEYRKVRQAHKKLGITVPSFVYACIVNSIDRRCKASTAQDDETPGAHLAYSAHASRWFPAETFMSRSPVNMAIVPGSGYISPHELRSEQRGRDLSLNELIALSKTIRQRQEAFLASPHIVSTLEQVADEVSRNIAETASKQQQAGTDPLVALCQNSPAICPPTLTSQGDNVFNRLFTAKGGSLEGRPANLEGDYIYVNRGYISGRTTDATVCFALLGFGGVLSLAGHFDSRFFDAKLVDAILDDVWKNLRAIAATVAEEEREAKL